MTLEEARTLLDYISISTVPGWARIRKLGNGEHVIIMKRMCYFIWELSDYTQFRELIEREQRKAQARAGGILVVV